MDQPSLALECYLRALEYEGENWDYEFWGRLYNQMGMLYARAGIIWQGYVIFLRKASAQYQLLNDAAGQDRILTEVKKYEMLRDSIGSLSARESIYQITSRYDVRPIREDLSKKELMLLQRGQERYLYAFIIGIILFICFLPLSAMEKYAGKRSSKGRSHCDVRLLASNNVCEKKKKRMNGKSPFWKKELRK